MRTPVFPCLELPLRCFISSVGHDKRITIDAEGNTCLTEKRQASDEWLIVEANGAYLLKNQVHDRSLFSDESGRLRASSDTIEGKSCRWHIRKLANGSYTFFNDRGGYLVVDKIRDVPAVCVHKPSSDKHRTEWNIEFLTGELCFMTSLRHNKRLRCHNAWGSSLSLSEKTTGWEIWRFIEAGNGHVRIANWTHSNEILCSDANGKVHTTNNLRGDAEKWEVQRAPHGCNGIILQSVSHRGRYLSVDSEGRIYTDDDFSPQESTWQLDAGHNNTFFLTSTCCDKRIGSRKDGEIFTTKDRKSTEAWELVKVDDAFFALRSKQHGKYLGQNLGGSVCTTGHMKELEKWKISRTASGGYHIISKGSSRYLSHISGECCLVAEKSPGTYAEWYLEPYMPETMTGSKMRNVAIGSVATAVAAPFAVMGAVAGLGFTSVGISGGSFGAWLMSAEAIASGGGVVAGGITATLQSIGAAGLGVVGTTVSAGTGALVGSTVSSAISDADARSKPNSSSVVEDGSIVEIENRPFCDWKNWPE